LAGPRITAMATASMASGAITARPRLVCSTVPVRLKTGRREFFRAFEDAGSEVVCMRQRVAGAHQFAGGGQFGAGAVGDRLATVAGDGGHESWQGQQAIDGRELREGVFCHGFHPDRAERS
jgi:hypothetical protein